MKVLTIIAFGVFALGVVTFRSVTPLPKIKATASAPFDWQQFLPGAAAQKRAVPGEGPSSAADDGAYGGVPSKFAANPMAPYLSLKPFLPVKPTMVSPFVDPNIFIGKKAELLNNLFGSGVGPASGSSFIPPWVSGGVVSSPNFFAEKKTTLLGTTFNGPITDSASSSPDSKRALEDPDSPSSAQPRLVGSPGLWGPPPGVIPTPKPSIVPPGFWAPDDSSAAGGVVDPSVFMDKKTKFLNQLFNSISAPSGSSSVSARAVDAEDPAADSAAKSAVPPSYWLQFIPAFATPPPVPTVKPTIVPPGFWTPTIVAKPVGLFGPAVPVVDPAQFVDKKTAFLDALFKTLNITVTPAPITTPEPTVDPVEAYKEKVAEFLDKLFSAIANNSSNDDAKASKRALIAAEKGKTPEDIKNLLGEANEVYDSATKLENEIDTRSTDAGNPVARRSVDADNDTSAAPGQLPVEALLSAKDKVVGTIIAEMGGIKNDILDTLAELLAKQKEAAATPPPTPASKKKPGPPFGPGGPFGIGGPFGAGGPWAGLAAATPKPKPTPDPEPFQKKVEFLGQVFDTLSQLQKDVSESLNQAVSDAAAAAAATTAATPTTPESKPSAAGSQAPNGTTLIELIRSKLNELANSSASNQPTTKDSSVQQVSKFARAIKSFPGKPGLEAPTPTVVDPSFWIPDAKSGALAGPDYYIGKTQEFLSKLFASKAGDDAAASNKEENPGNKAGSKEGGSGRHHHHNHH